VFSSPSLGRSLPSLILSRRTTSQRVPSEQSDLVHVAFSKLGPQSRLRTGAASTSSLRITTRKRVRGFGGLNRFSIRLSRLVIAFIWSSPSPGVMRKYRKLLFLVPGQVKCRQANFDVLDLDGLLRVVQDAVGSADAR
jgi:hypothetical protein